MFVHTYGTKIRKGVLQMAHFGSKGWLVKQLKDAGVRYHPVERRKLETYRASTLYGLFVKYVKNKQEN